MGEASILAQGLKTYFSEAQLRRLASARVGIAGAGGLGSNVVMLLVRSGVRRFIIADGDTVAASNLNRQFYWPQDVGKAKVEVLKERLLELEPKLEFEAKTLWLKPETACGFFAGCDVVVEALDDAELKAGLCAALASGGFYVVAASGVGGFGLPPMQVRRLGASLVCVGDFSTTADASMPPLAPRVIQAAALQADLVLSRILQA